MDANQKPMPNPQTGCQPVRLFWQPPETPARNKAMLSFFDRNGRTYCNVGTIGHVDWGMSPLTAAIIYNLPAVRHKLKRTRDWLLDQTPITHAQVF